MKHGYFFGDKNVHLFTEDDRRLCDGLRGDIIIFTEAPIGCPGCLTGAKGFGRPAWMIDELIKVTKDLIKALGVATSHIPTEVCKRRSGRLGLFARKILSIRPRLGNYNRIAVPLCGM